MWLSIMPPWVGSGCRQMSVATGSRSAGRASSPTRSSPSAVCRVTGSRRAGKTVLALISLIVFPVPVVRGCGSVGPVGWRDRGAHRPTRRPGRRCRRRCQHGRCQCRRSAGPGLRLGQATTCGIPGGISWSHPGQRYVLAEAAPGTGRTTQSPSGHDSTCSGPEGGGAGAAGRRIRRGLMSGCSAWPRDYRRRSRAGDQPVTCSPRAPGSLRVNRPCRHPLPGARTGSAR